jgi:hypothetical protein
MDIVKKLLQMPHERGKMKMDDIIDIFFFQKLFIFHINELQPVMKSTRDRFSCLYMICI